MQELLQAEGSLGPRGARLGLAESEREAQGWDGVGEEPRGYRSPGSAGQPQWWGAEESVSSHLHSARGP